MDLLLFQYPVRGHGVVVRDLEGMDIHDLDMMEGLRLLQAEDKVEDKVEDKAVDKVEDKAVDKVVDKAVVDKVVEEMYPFRPRKYRNCLILRQSHNLFLLFLQ